MIETKLKLINEALKAWNDAGRPENETLSLMEWLLKKEIESQLRIMDLRDALAPFAKAKAIKNIEELDIQNAADAYKTH